MILDYINSFPIDVKERLLLTFDTIKNLCPEAEERMSYAMPTFFLGENLVHFAGYKNHIGFYPGPEALNAFKSQIESYKNSKGAVQFPHNKPLPLKLIRDITKYRLKEVKEKAINSKDKK